MTPTVGHGDVLPLADTLVTLIRVVNKTLWLISTLSPASQSSGLKKKKKRMFDSGALLEEGMEGFSHPDFPHGHLDRAVSVPGPLKSGRSLTHSMRRAGFLMLSALATSSSHRAAGSQCPQESGFVAGTFLQEL